MQNELPLSLVEEQTECDPGADGRCEDGEADCLEQPGRVDDFMLLLRLGLARTGLVLLLGAACHFFSHFSTCRNWVACIWEAVSGSRFA